MDVESQERWGVLVIRAWTEGVAGTRLKARIISTRDSHNEIAGASGIDEVVTRVRRWLEDLNAGGDRDAAIRSS